MLHKGIQFLFQEQRRLSRGDMTLNIPPPGSERGRRMSRHDALASTPSSDPLLSPIQSRSMDINQRLKFIHAFRSSTILNVHFF